MAVNDDMTELTISKWDTILKLNLQNGEIKFTEHDNDRIYLNCGKVYVQQTLENQYYAIFDVHSNTELLKIGNDFKFSPNSKKVLMRKGSYFYIGDIPQVGKKAMENNNRRLVSCDDIMNSYENFFFIDNHFVAVETDTANVYAIFRQSDGTRFCTFNMVSHMFIQ